MKKVKIKAAKHNFDLIVIGPRGMGSANEI